MTVILADKQFIDYYNITSTRSGLVATIPWATTGVAQLMLGGTLAGLVGRLWALRVSILFMCIGVVVQSVPNSFGVLILGRLMTGLGFGCVYIATNLYVSECAPRLLRGSFVGTVAQFGYQLGTLIAFWSGYGMSFHKSPYNIAWRVSNVIQIPIGLIFICVSFLYIESPRWLLEKQPENPQRALKALARLRSGSPEDDRVRVEFHELVASHEYRKQFETGYMGILKSGPLRKRLLYGFYAMALQQFGGIAALTMYATLIYQSLGWDKGSQALAINGIQSVLQLLIVLVNTFTVDRFGRKTLLIWGFTIQSIALLILSSLCTSFPNNDNKAAAVAEIAMFFIVGMTYCWSNGPIPPVRSPCPRLFLRLTNTVPGNRHRNIPSTRPRQSLRNFRAWSNSLLVSHYPTLARLPRQSRATELLAPSRSQRHSPDLRHHYPARNQRHLSRANGSHFRAG